MIEEYKWLFSVDEEEEEREKVGEREGERAVGREDGERVGGTKKK